MYPYSRVYATVVESHIIVDIEVTASQFQLPLLIGMSIFLGPDMYE